MKFYSVYRMTDREDFLLGSALSLGNAKKLASSHYGTVVIKCENAKNNRVKILFYDNGKLINVYKRTT